MSEIDLIRENNRLREIVENLVQPEVGRWVDWAPTVDQNGAVAATVEFARYIALDKTVHITARLAITGAGVANNAIEIQGIPFSQRVGAVGGTVQVLNFGTATYVGQVAMIGAALIHFRRDGTLGVSGDVIGINPNFALANNDFIIFSYFYERV